MKKSLFLHGSNPLIRFILLASLSLTLLFLDQRSERVDLFRSALSTAIYPLQVMADLPARLGGWFSSSFTTHETSLQERNRLAKENRQLEIRLQQLTALERENQQLRDLLNSSSRLQTGFSSARLLAVSMNPFQQRVILDKGLQDGVETGTSILDERGLMGQIIRTHAYHSEAMLISDPDHATPVHVLRNGIRGIAAGMGRTDQLKLLYLPVNTDIRVGDQLVTSGLGGRFPADYPVATVASVIRPGGASFAEITARPLAGLDDSREILLINAQGSTAAPR